MDQDPPPSNVNNDVNFSTRTLDKPPYIKPLMKSQIAEK